MTERVRRICMLGGRSVGKSTVTIQFVEHHFASGYNPTIENTFQRDFKHLERDYHLEIIDTAGHDEYTLFNNAHAVGVHGYIMVFAKNSRQSFEIVQIINEKLLNALGVDKFPRVLVGNKSDLQEHQVTTAQGQALADEWGCPYVETSGKHNERVDDLFAQILDEIDRDTQQAPEPKKESFCVLL